MRDKVALSANESKACMLSWLLEKSLTTQCRAAKLRQECLDGWTIGWFVSQSEKEGAGGLDWIGGRGSTVSAQVVREVVFDETVVCYRCVAVSFGVSRERVSPSVSLDVLLNLNVTRRDDAMKIDLVSFLFTLFLLDESNNNYQSICVVVCFVQPTS